MTSSCYFSRIISCERIFRTEYPTLLARPQVQSQTTIFVHDAKDMDEGRNFFHTVLLTWFIGKAVLKMVRYVEELPCQVVADMAPPGAPSCWRRRRCPRPRIACGSTGASEAKSATSRATRLAWRQGERVSETKEGGRLLHVFFCRNCYRFSRKPCSWSPNC